MTSRLEIILWGKRVAAAALDRTGQFVTFAYDPAFVQSGIQIAPLKMPLSSQVYAFPFLPRESFKGLPGLLADSLPDRFGNAVIDAWLARQGLTAADFNVVDRLSYIGARGMGALEFRPQKGPRNTKSSPIDVAQMVELAALVLSDRKAFSTQMKGRAPDAAMRDILRISTSAGGARAKAIVAWNEATGEIRSGQVEADAGFGYWLIKFDGVANNKDKELADPKGFGAIEYAYHLMAKSAGIQMSDCRLFEENGRRHFITRRFDRGPGGAKLHMQSLAAMAHYDFNSAGAYSYEQAFETMRLLGLPQTAMDQQFLRMVFNIVARNHDDHVKNIAFLMDQSGAWSLSPAFDVSYSYNPGGLWTSQHQMSCNGKRDGFTHADLMACARIASVKASRARDMIGRTLDAVRAWPSFAAQAGVDKDWTAQIAKTVRLNLPNS